MPSFSPDSYANVINPIGGGLFRLGFYETEHSIADVLASGYFAHAKDCGIRSGDAIEISVGGGGYLSVGVRDIDSNGTAIIAILNESLDPSTFRAAADGVTDDLQVLQRTAAIHLLTGVPIDGRDRTYGISGQWTITAGASDVVIDRLHLKQLDPNVTSRHTLVISAANKARISRSKFDRNGNGAHGHVLDKLLQFTGCVDPVVSDCEFTGENAGTAVQFFNCTQGRAENNWLHDLVYDQATWRSASGAVSTDDNIQGIHFAGTSRRYASGNVIERLGVKATVGAFPWPTGQAPRYRYSRGIANSDGEGGRIVENHIEDTDQGVDVSGSGKLDALNIIGNVVKRSTTFAIKLSNASHRCTVSANTIIDAGLTGIVVTASGWDRPYLTNYPVIDGNFISGLGFNQVWVTHFRCGISVEWGTSSTVAAKYHPNGIRPTNNMIRTYKRDPAGVAYYDNRAPNFPQDKSYIEPTIPHEADLGQRIRFATDGTLFGGLTPGQDYFASITTLELHDSGGNIINTGGLMRVSLTYEDAIDGRYIADLSAAGSGNHTIEFMSDMDYGGENQRAFTAGWAPNVWADSNTIDGALVAETYGWHNPTCVGSISPQSMPNSVSTPIQCNVRTKAGRSQISTSVPEGTIDEEGWWEIEVQAIWSADATASGIRRLSIFTDISSVMANDGYAEVTLLPGVTQLPMHTRGRYYFLPGQQFRCEATQTSGGSLNGSFQITLSKANPE